VAYWQQEQALVKKLQKDGSKQQQYILYALYYLLPFHFAFFAWLLFRKTNLFFTEHLIIQLFGLAQLIWFLTLALAFIFGFSWTYIKLTQFNLPNWASTISVYFLQFTLLASVIYLYQLYWRCYGQSWWLSLGKFLVVVLLSLLTDLLLGILLLDVVLVHLL
jgi:hypothetical protein